MISEGFHKFVQENIVPLDELARRYGEYRLMVIQSYMDDLHALTEQMTPVGYSFEKTFQVVAESEQVCGWKRELVVLGYPTTVTIGFGFLFRTAAMVGGWPLMKDCWTGVRLYLPPDKRRQVRARARELALDTMAMDGNWLFWRPWNQFSGLTIEGFNKQIFEERSSSQHEIVEQLSQWQADLDKVLLPLNQTNP